MSLFDKLQQPRGQAQQANPVQQANPAQLMQQLRKDPEATLKSAGLEVPQGMNDPQRIVQHLIDSGQVPQTRFTQALQMVQRFMGGPAR